MDEIQTLKLSCLESPHDADLWHAYASAAIDEGDLDTAIIAARRASELSKDFVHTSLSGRLELLIGDPLAAKRHFISILQNRPDELDFRAYLGSAELQIGNLEQAKECFSKVLALNPKHEHALLGKAKVELTQGNPDVAVEICIGALESEAEDADGFIMTLGESVLRMGDAERAQGIYENACQFNPENRDAWIALVNVQLLLKAHAEANETLESAKQVFPGDLTLMLLEGQLAFLREEPLKARPLFNHVLEIDPEAAEARVSLAMLELGEGNIQLAAKIISPAVENPAPRLDALLVAASVAEASEDYASAVRFAKSATEILPENYRAQLSLGRNLLNTRDFPPARRALQKALALADSDEARSVAQQLLDAAPSA